VSVPVIADLEVEDRRVLVRCDLNVPMANGRITDDLRVRASVPTLEALLGRGARVVVCSHLGRPKGRVVEDLRLGPVGRRLGELVGRDVKVLDEIFGETARRTCESDEPLVMLENLRFDAREEQNDATFANELASLAQAYVNDAFGASHRAHASIVGVAQRLPAAAGLLLQKEVDRLGYLLHDPARPFVAVLGGAKVSDKLGVLRHLLQRVDALCVGGAMAFTLLAAQQQLIGRSPVERERVQEVDQLLSDAATRGARVVLPSDVVAASEIGPGVDSEVVTLEELGDRVGADIGPRTSELFAETISGARTIVWNGPMGVFEIEQFARGTEAVAQAVAGATRSGAYTVVGGGDSAAALARLGLSDAVTHVSTGGGATLELLEGRQLPGIAVLTGEGRA
jgi:phosphoglycerate kinase